MLQVQKITKTFSNVISDNAAVNINTNRIIDNILT